MRRTAPLILTGLAGLVLLTGCGGSESARSMGQPLPDLSKAEGWAGAPQPQVAPGQVVVIQAWAHWCGPCRRETPEIVALHKQFQPRGVQFIGLTPDGASAIDDITGAMTELHMDWPTGYGAKELLMSIPVRLLPTVLVYDRQGKLAWRSDQGGSIESAIETALRS